MGIFSKKPIDPVEETSRRYLAVAPPVPRTEMLTASIIQRVRQLELADALQLGVVVSSSELGSVAALVREVMYQDLSLSVQVARKCTLWQDMIATLLAGSYGSGLDLYFAANGVEWSKATPDSIRVEAASRPTGELQIEESSLVSMLSVALIFGREEALRRAPAEWKFYSNLQTGALTTANQNLAHRMVAWSSLAAGRLLNADRVDIARGNPGFPAWNPSYKSVTLLTEAGWYPNPQKTPKIVEGDAAFQRFWDGTDWSGRHRHHDGRSWKVADVPLNSAPVD